jgi:hypothetical protein
MADFAFVGVFSLVIGCQPFGLLRLLSVCLGMSALRAFGAVFYIFGDVSPSGL